MASHSAVRVQTFTLGAGVADDVTLSLSSIATLELVHHGNVTNPVYFRLDATTPVAAADENEVLLPNERLRVAARGGTTQVLGFISAGAATVTVIGLT